MGCGKGTGEGMSDLRSDDNMELYRAAVTDLLFAVTNGQDGVALTHDYDTCPIWADTLGFDECNASRGCIRCRLAMFANGESWE